jgi:hypothetical protein
MQTIEAVLTFFAEILQKENAGVTSKSNVDCVSFSSSLFSL